MVQYFQFKKRRSPPVKKTALSLEKICAYCQYATLIGDSGACICEKKGAVPADGHCRRFKEDLLKVKPHLPTLPGPGEAENFFR